MKTKTEKAVTLQSRAAFLSGQHLVCFFVILDVENELSIFHHLQPALPPTLPEINMFMCSSSQPNCRKTI